VGLLLSALSQLGTLSLSGARQLLADVRYLENILSGAVTSPGPEPWTLDPGPWTLDPLRVEPWTLFELNPGPWTLDHGPWTVFELNPGAEPRSLNARPSLCSSPLRASPRLSSPALSSPLLPSPLLSSPLLSSPLKRPVFESL
jgi:hypothetical protein